MSTSFQTFACKLIVAYVGNFFKVIPFYVQARYTIATATSKARSQRRFVVFVLLFYVNGKHLRSCGDVSKPNHTFPGQA